MDNNNRNGKEVPRDQTLRNGQKENSRNSVNRIKKNNQSAEKEAGPGDAKKISLNINKQQGGQKKSTSKGHVIKLEDKESRVHPVDTTPRQNKRPYPKNTPSNVNTTTNIPAVETPVFKKVRGNNKSNTSGERFTITDKAGQWLLIAAAIFLVAWAVVFFYYHIGGNSHMLLAFAVLCAVISLAGKKKGLK
jgi:hypothetical protein